MRSSMLPIAKSSEALYLNKTLFEKFSDDTKINTEDLNTFDGLFKIARLYYDWSGGQNFMQLNDFYNYSIIGMHVDENHRIVRLLILKHRFGDEEK